MGDNHQHSPDNNSEPLYYNMFDEDQLHMAFTPTLQSPGFPVLASPVGTPYYYPGYLHPVAASTVTSPNAAAFARAGRRDPPIPHHPEPDNDLSAPFTSVASVTAPISSTKTSSTSVATTHTISSDISSRTSPSFHLLEAPGSSSLYDASRSDHSAPTSQLLDFSFHDATHDPYVTAATIHQSNSLSQFACPNSFRQQQQQQQEQQQTSPTTTFGFGTSNSIAANPWTGGSGSRSSATAAGDDAVAADMFGCSTSTSSVTSSRPKRTRRVVSFSGHPMDDGIHSPSAFSRSSGGTSSAASTGGAGTGTSGSKSRLRQAARTSKNKHHTPAATPDERKARASHNLVEKQYRTRLNAQFESLLEALPESSRSAGGERAGREGGVSGDDDVESRGGRSSRGSRGRGSRGGRRQRDGAERRVSKAEVLDTACQHIKNLESQNCALEVEQAELLQQIEALKPPTQVPQTPVLQAPLQSPSGIGMPIIFPAQPSPPGMASDQESSPQRQQVQQRPDQGR